MADLLKKYRVFLFFLYITLFMSLGSTWVNQKIHLPVTVSKIIVSLIYLPFVIAIIWKLWGDIKERPKDRITRIYYIFAFYYTGVTIFRFINGLEVKENLYYSLILFGSLALYQQILRGRIQISKYEYKLNILLIAAYMVVYILSDVIIGRKLFLFSPINSLTTTFSLLILLPFFMDCIGESGQINKYIWLYSTVFIGILVAVSYSTSRSIFNLCIFTVLVLFIANVKNTKKLFRMFVITISGVVIIGLLFAIDFCDMRYALYRESNTLNLIIERVAPPSDPDQTLAPADPSPDIQLVEVSVAQIQRSDTGRSDLVKNGIEQIKMNPWFGTGDVLYETITDMHLEGGEIYTHEQSSHNFIIESLVCYGAIGFIFLGILFIVIVFSTGLFKKKVDCEWYYRVSMVLTILCYLAMGFIQSIAYNTIICPLFLFMIAYYGNCFIGTEEHTDVQQENIGP